MPFLYGINDCLSIKDIGSLVVHSVSTCDNLQQIDIVVRQSEYWKASLLKINNQGIPSV